MHLSTHSINLTLFINHAARWHSLLYHKQTAETGVGITGAGDQAQLLSAKQPLTGWNLRWYQYVCVCVYQTCYSLLLLIN